MKSKSANRINRASGVFVKQPQSAAEPEVYSVKDGDTVDGIAAEYGVSRDDILELNPTLKDKVYVDKQGRTIILIKAGKKLILPQGANKQPGTSGSSGNNNIPKNNKPDVFSCVGDTCYTDEGQTKFDNTADIGGRCTPMPEFGYTTMHNAEKIPSVNDILKDAKQPDKVYKPSIELFARHVDPTGKFQHSYTIFTNSQGQKTIITGFPENNNAKGMLFDKLKVFDIPYIEENQPLLGKDWDSNVLELDKVKRWTIQKIELDNDIELNNHLSKAREAVKMIETGNNGGRFDYDICFTDKCWGGNSNTVQKKLWNAMGYEIKVPKGFSLPGIKGEFYNEPGDDLKHI